MLAGQVIHQPAAETTATRVDELRSEWSDKGKWRARLNNLAFRRRAVLALTFAMHNHIPLECNYFRKYGPAWSSTESRFFPDGESLAPASIQQGPAVKAGPRCPGAEAACAWHWREYPLMSPALIWYRRINTVWMYYIVLKYAFPAALEGPLAMLSLEGPPHCYLPGRFVFSEQVRYPSAVIFALIQLMWQAKHIHLASPNYMLSALYFLLFDDRDIIAYYRLLERQARDANAAKPIYWCAPHKTIGRAVVNVEQQRSLKEAGGCERMFHDVMSARVERSSGPMFKLRPNRTPESCRRLRKHLIDTLTAGSLVFASLAVIITTIIMAMLLDSKRYLYDYPGCNPDLERLLERDQPVGVFARVRLHQTTAVLLDICENVFLWAESGFACTLSVVQALVLNYDLMIYWKYLDAKMLRALKQAQFEFFHERHLPHRVMSSRDAPIHHPNNSSQEQTDLINELQMEWQDFIKQLEHSGAFASDCTTMYIIAWFALFGFYVYTLIETQESLPFVVHLTLAYVVFIIATLAFTCLTPQRCCRRSYTKLCSLMAYDSSTYKTDFMRTVDYFVTKRICFNLFRGHRMTATSFLTIIGWSFSCFFILASLHNYHRKLN